MKSKHVLSTTRASLQMNAVITCISGITLFWNWADCLDALWLKPKKNNVIAFVVQSFSKHTWNLLKYCLFSSLSLLLNKYIRFFRSRFFCVCVYPFIPCVIPAQSICHTIAFARKYSRISCKTVVTRKEEIKKNQQQHIVSSACTWLVSVIAIPTTCSSLKL